MSATNDGGPAFPHVDERRRDVLNYNGMTLRDYFAAKESLYDIDEFDVDIPVEFRDELAGYSISENASAQEGLRWQADWRSALKYIRADAMISAREKGAK